MVKLAARDVQVGRSRDARLPLTPHSASETTESLPANISWPLRMGEDSPALYCAGVRDYDETRGLLVLGSAYGELALYDYSGTDPERLEQCFTPINLRPMLYADTMPTVRV